MTTESAQCAVLSGGRAERKLLWFGGVLVVLLVSIISVFDPYLGSLVPSKWWDKLFLGSWSHRFSVLLLLLLLSFALLVELLRRVSYHAVLVVGIFVAAQISGFRLSILDPLDLLTFAGVMVWLAQELLSPRQTVRLPSLLYFAMALLFLDFLHLTHQNPVRFMIGFLGLFKVILLAFLIVNVIQTESSIRLAIKAFIGVAIFSALIGVGQFILFKFAGIPFTLIEDSETIFKPTPLGMVMRVSGLCATVQHMSGFLMFGLGFLLFLIPQWQHLRYRMLGCAAVILLLVAILLTWNYGAIFATGLVVLMFPFFQWPKRSLHIVLALLTLALLFYFTGVVEWVYSVSFGDSGVLKGLSQRHTLMSLGFEKIWRDPLMGTGLRDFAGFSGNFWHRPVHNAYMQAGTEIGILSMLLFIVMLLVLVTQLIIALIHAPVGLQPILKAAVVGMIAMMLLMFSEPMFDHSNTWLFLGLCQSIVSLALAKTTRLIKVHD
ncbi:MAG TPA: hypothetical protein ENK06_01270 [Gammaproteobacteria bacterium]|nr:hypothetical protein [Gammaproteobacteria bacterium]